MTIHVTVCQHEVDRRFVDCRICDRELAESEELKRLRAEVTRRGSVIEALKRENSTIRKTTADQCQEAMQVKEVIADDGEIQRVLQITEIHQLGPGIRIVVALDSSQQEPSR